MPREINHKHAFGSRALKRLAQAFEYARREGEAQNAQDRPLDTAELAILDQAFETAWAVIQAHDPFRDLDRDQQLQLALRQKLFALALTGQRHPETLRNLVLADMPLGERQIQAA
jgi:hypothetical protein